MQLERAARAHAAEMTRDIQNRLPGAVDRWLIARRSDAAWKQRALGLLVELLGVDTTPKSDPAACATAEHRCFGIIRRELAATVPAARTHLAPIRREIADHPYFTWPYYAGDAGDAKTDAVGRVYGGRGNLFARVARPGAPRLIINGHLDTVAPFLPVRVEGDIAHGRGAVDDKGPCLSMLLAAEMLGEVQREFGIEPACDLLLQFVIDEEPGGNGSLSAALDVKPTPPDAVVVLECTGMTAYPANRGAVWHATRLESASCGHEVLLEAMAFVLGGLDDLGRALKAESDHPLFPHRPVQTCHGRIGPFGVHPSRVQDYVCLRLRWQGIPKSEIVAVVDEAVGEYCRVYGDKTQQGAADTVLAQHLRWSDAAEDRAVLELFGLAGHMGAVDRLDGAITKAGAIIRKLVRAKTARGGAWNTLEISLAGADGGHSLELEGGQGFLPTHEMEAVCERMRQAVRAATREYLVLRGRAPDAICPTVTFEKLHNAAFARRTDGPAMGAILRAAGAVGAYHGEPVRGWDVSCDARIFAREFPDAEIITFGPGLLARAHANDEQIDINDVLIAAEVLARLALEYGRST